MQDITIEKAKISDLKPHPKNPRIHADSAIDKLVRSIEVYGWTNPILASADGLVLAGHARLKAAEKAGLDEVPVIYLPLEGPLAEAYLIADNRLQDETDWDYPTLTDLLLDLDSGVLEDLEITGFSLKEIEDMMTRWHDDPDILEDEMPDLPEEATAKPGDIYQLGRHRLMCGDATRCEDVENLMAGEKADMIFTDPPYNVDYGASKNHPSWKIRSIKNDSMSSSDWLDFNYAFISNILDFYRGGDIYIWGASGPEGMRQRLLLIDMGFHWSATIVWKKQQLVLSPAKYQRLYEPCFYGWFDKSSYVGDRKQVEVWEFDRPQKSELHPTMKPVALCAHGIKNSSCPGDIVLDLFGGSGSTLMACEQAQRTCYMMELDPAYVDVIIKRWENHAGEKAQLIQSI